jgi:hypothetical protein
MQASFIEFQQDFAKKSQIFLTDLVHPQINRGLLNSSENRKDYAFLYIYKFILSKVPKDLKLYIKKEEDK